jgi:hypothetical protein
VVHFSVMSAEAILQELPTLNDADLDRIRDLLNSILDQRHVDPTKEMARRIEDEDRSRWMTLEEMEARFKARYGDKMG